MGGKNSKVDSDKVIDGKQIAATIRGGAWRGTSLTPASKVPCFQNFNLMEDNLAFILNLVFLSLHPGPTPR